MTRPRGLYLMCVAAAALVAVSVIKARGHPDASVLGGGVGASVVVLVAGIALVAAAVDVVRRRELALAGALLAASAGLALYVLPEPAPGAALFTAGLLGAGLMPAAAAHAALLYPGGHRAGGADRGFALMGYMVQVGLLGLLPTLIFDPARAGCSACASNLLLVHWAPDTWAWISRWGPRAAVVAEVVLAGWVLRRLLGRSQLTRYAAAPVSLAAVAVLALAALANLRAAGGRPVDEAARTVSLLSAGTLVILAGGIGWRPLRAARVRAALGRLTLAASVKGDDVRSAIARALGDSTAVLLFPDPEQGTPVTTDGSPASAPGPGRERTVVERQGRTVAWLEHGADTRPVAELPPVMSLALEREALRVAQLLQQTELRASTARLVAAGERERHRLERDLHDGAQQRLLALNLAIGAAQHNAPPAEAELLARAGQRLSSVQNELRRLAHGIHSAALAEEGLTEAVLALVVVAGGRVVAEALPRQRVSAEAETAAYRLVAASLALARPPYATLRLAIRARDEDLDITIQVEGVTAEALSPALAHASARVAALGGVLAVEPEAGGACVRGWVPSYPG